MRQRTCCSLALIYLGRPQDSERAEDIAAAEAVLKSARPYVRSIDSAQFMSDLASGEVCVSVGWSSAIEQARNRGAQGETPIDVVYVIPKEGAPLWCDMGLDSDRRAASGECLRVPRLPHGARSHRPDHECHEISER